MKKHYVKRWYRGKYGYADAACGEAVSTPKGKNESTFNKNHVTCKNCRRTKLFKGVK